MERAAPYLAATLRGREQTHRRRGLLTIGGLIVLGTSPVVGHHLVTRASGMLAGRDHVLNICLIALHELLSPVHFVFHTLLFVGLGYALWDRVRAIGEVRRVLGALETRSPGENSVIARSAVRAGLNASRIHMVDGLPNPAFTVGWWTPAVYVASELPDVLDEQQLAAVLAHEAAHVARRDPFRLSVLRFFACVLFYIPALRRLADDAADEAEIAADDHAASSTPVVLASAILVIASVWGREAADASGARLHASGAVVGFQQLGLLQRRIRRLLGEDAAPRTHVTRRSVWGAASVLVAVWMSGMIMAHPLPDENGWTASLARPAHCHHDGEFALSHLFCLGVLHHVDGDCPHAGQ